MTSITSNALPFVLVIGTAVVVGLIRMLLPWKQQLLAWGGLIVLAGVVLVVTGAEQWEYTTTGLFMIACLLLIWLGRPQAP